MAGHYVQPDTRYSTSTVGVGQTINFTAAPGSQPIAPPHVGNEILEMERRGHEMHTVLDELVKRLEGVLAPVGPDSAGGTGQPSAPCSPVVQSLRAHGYRIDAGIERLREVLRRLEL